ncbi:MAG: ABC transporter permease [Anaerolineae bacterium]
MAEQVVGGEVRAPAAGAQGWRAWRATAGLPLLSLLAGACAWELAGHLAGWSFLPPLSRVLQVAFDMLRSGQLLGPLSASLLGLGMGHGLAVTCGTGLGVLMGRYRKVEHLFDLYIDLLLAAPSLVFAPVLFGLFGTGRATQVAMVFLFAFPIITANTMAGMRAADGSLVAMATAFGASRRQLFQRVLWPAALPMVMAGQRVGLARAVKGMVNGEMFVALFGLGALLRGLGSRFDMAGVYAVLLVVVALATLGTAGVQALERRLTRWLP